MKKTSWPSHFLLTVFCFCLLNQSCQTERDRNDPTAQDSFEKEEKKKNALTYKIAYDEFQFRRIPGLGITRPTFFARIIVTNTSDVAGEFTLIAKFECKGEIATVFGKKMIGPHRTEELEGKTEVKKNSFEEDNLNPSDCQLLEKQIIAPEVSQFDNKTDYLAASER